MPDKQPPRGIRNNNPGNIRKSNTEWQGKVGDDGTFLTFDTPEHGVRAMAKILLTYYRKYRLNTVEKIIHRWAPPVENNTAAYVKSVAAAVGVPPPQLVDVENPDILNPLVRAIIRHENGIQPYPISVIAAGVSLALGHEQSA